MDQVRDLGFHLLVTANSKGLLWTQHGAGLAATLGSEVVAVERMDDDEVRIRGIIVYKTFKHESNMSLSVLTFSVRVCCIVKEATGKGYLSLGFLFPLSILHLFLYYMIYKAQNRFLFCVLQCKALLEKCWNNSTEPAADWASLKDSEVIPLSRRSSLCVTRATVMFKSVVC